LILVRGSSPITYPLFADTYPIEIQEMFDDFGRARAGRWRGLGVDLERHSAALEGMRFDHRGWSRALERGDDTHPNTRALFKSFR